MTEIIQAVRGMNDILPSETGEWQYIEHIMRQIYRSHGYQEIRFPIVEKTELFKRSIGEVTDIVEKEMYTFLDRNEESLSLRPEGTACCVRATLEHGLLHNQTQHLWYAGPYFRHERPQKGRYRQFHQCAAEVFGLTGPDIDAEVILLSAAIFEKLGLSNEVTLQINSLGTFAARQQYREHLVAYFTQHKTELDEDSLRRLDKNPLRILDSKNPAMRQVIENAPKLLDHLDEESLTHFATLQSYLKQAGLRFEVNPCLVRGLDYYSRTVFEWVTDKLGAQGTVCSGGRYDGLVEQLGGKPTPALGFAFGMERLILLLQHVYPSSRANSQLHVYLMTDSDNSFAIGLKLANYLRSQVAGLNILMHCGGGSLKNQFKKADKSGAEYAIIIGEQEAKSGLVSLKNLRKEMPQQSLDQDNLAEHLKLHVSKKG